MPIRKGFRAKFHALLHRCRQRKSLRVFALGQLLRHFANRIDKAVGEDHGERVRHWFEDKKRAGMRYSKTRRCRR